MNIFYLIIFFVLGLLFGSFLTVVGIRHPKGENFITNRSYCDTCHHVLSFFDLFPVLSYVFLRGRCRYCHAKIDSLSTYMEIFTGILFALSYYVFGISFGLFFALGIVCMLVVLSVSDISYLIIPDDILIFFAGYFIILITFQSGVVVCLYRILSGMFLFAVMYGIMLLGDFLFHKETLGGGDVKLMFVFGIVLSPLLGLFSIFLGSVLALPVSIFILIKKHRNLVPFGPFLLISFAFIYFTRIDIKMILEFIRSF